MCVGEQCVTLQALQMVSIRVRDTKISVRREAAAQLFNVFRYTYASHSTPKPLPTELPISAPFPTTVAERDPQLVQLALDFLRQLLPLSTCSDTVSSPFL